jgi:transcriptional regulator with XRE-family HTH domain
MLDCNHTYSSRVNRLTFITGKLVYTMARFGQRLADAREATGLNRSQLARLIGVTPQRITQIENHGGELSVTPAIKAARLLGVRIEWLALQEKPETLSELPSITSEADAELLRNWAELLPEQREDYSTRIKVDAEKSRKVIQQARERGLLPEAPGLAADSRLRESGYVPINHPSSAPTSPALPQIRKTKLKRAKVSQDSDTAKGGKKR